METVKGRIKSIFYPKSGKNHVLLLENGIKLSGWNDKTTGKCPEALEEEKSYLFTYEVNGEYKNYKSFVPAPEDTALVAHETIEEVPKKSWDDNRRRKEIMLGQAINLSQKHLMEEKSDVRFDTLWETDFKRYTKEYFRLMQELEKEIL